ncbi:YtxH domain-containing protein [Deinococcus hohokamensis]|uniref:YtxH domain-containing protein n=1 Tax=Deinococcus hohokamensis TaxID=309883 RepID=A0ABV9I8G8_9DEIO
MNVQQLTDDVKAALQKREHEAGDHAAARAAKALVKEQTALKALLTKQGAELTKQGAELASVREDLRRLERAHARHSSGGFPWGLLLLAGGAYALYRNNASVRAQVDGALKRLNPGPEGNLTRAADAAKGAVQDLVQGHSPASGLRTAGGELQRAGEKTVESSGDLVDRADTRVQDGLDGLKRGDV